MYFTDQNRPKVNAMKINFETIFKYKNEYHKQLELKKLMKKIRSFS